MQGVGRRPKLGQLHVLSQNSNHEQGNENDIWIHVIWQVQLKVKSPVVNFCFSLYFPPKVEPRTRTYRQEVSFGKWFWARVVEDREGKTEKEEPSQSCIIKLITALGSDVILLGIICRTMYKAAQHYPSGGWKSVIFFQQLISHWLPHELLSPTQLHISVHVPEWLNGLPQASYVAEKPS